MHTHGTIVVGAGISGLAYAHARLALDREAPLAVLEAGPRAGGQIATLRRDGWRLETGPEVLAGGQELRRLTEELGLERERLSSTAARRFLQKGTRLLEVPQTPGDLSTSTILSFPAKMRLLAEPSRAGDQALDGSIADFVRHRLGEEALERVVEPLVASLFAGDPEQISLQATFPRVVDWVREHGSLFAAMKARTGRGSGLPSAEVWRPVGGVQALIDALVAALGARLSLSTPVTALAPEAEGIRVTCASGDTLLAGRVVLAVPGPVAARLLAGVADEAAGALAAMPCESLVAVHHGYRRSAVDHGLDGFGFLSPRAEGGRTLVTVFSSSLEPAVAPDGHVLLRTLLGGARDPEASQLSDEDLSELVRGESSRLLGIRGAPVLTHVVRWPAAVPRYDLDHPARRRVLARALPSGLTLLGNFLDGLDVGALVRDARERAHQDAG
jgi:oxygen-dependent protoporphyrinogen oxidase